MEKEVKVIGFTGIWGFAKQECQISKEHRDLAFIIEIGDGGIQALQRGRKGPNKYYETGVDRTSHQKLK